MPAIFRPARASGSTATPPAAPNPTTATSTGFRLMAMLVSGGAVGGVMIGLNLNAHLLVGGGGGQARAGIADQVPAREVLVAPIKWVAKHAFHGETPGAIEERTGVSEAFGVTAFHGGENGVLLFGGQIDERARLGAARESIGGFQAFDESGFFTRQIIGEGAIDVFGNSAGRSAGTKLVFGDEAI